VVVHHRDVMGEPIVRGPGVEAVYSVDRKGIPARFGTAMVVAIDLYIHRQNCWTTSPIDRMGQ
jgi:hypothetical protein